jgi:hypothetical protein
MAGPLAAQQASPSTTAAPAEVSRDGTLAVTSAVQETAIGQDLPVNSGEFQRRLLTNEEEVNRLKEKVFRSKATLQLLQEVVLQGASAGAHATLVHSSILGNTYTIESVNYYLDGQSIYSKVFERGADAGTKEFKVHDGAIPAGNHTVSLSMVLRGSGYGVFSYVDRYTFNVQSSYTFTVDEGKTCVVRVRTKERKGIGRSFVERPTVEYDMSCTRMDQGK